MKNAVAIKTLLLIIVVSVASLCITGCENDTKKSIATLREDAVTSYVNLPNPNGSVTPVKIKRNGNVWVGPKGEIYTAYPTVEQLQPLYGTK